MLDSRALFCSSRWLPWKLLRWLKALHPLPSPRIITVCFPLYFVRVAPPACGCLYHRQRIRFSSFTKIPRRRWKLLWRHFSFWLWHPARRCGFVFRLGNSSLSNHVFLCWDAKGRCHQETCRVQTLQSHRRPTRPLGHALASGVAWRTP